MAPKSLSQKRNFSQNPKIYFQKTTKTKRKYIHLAKRTSNNLAKAALFPQHNKYVVLKIAFYFNPPKKTKSTINYTQRKKRNEQQTTESSTNITKKYKLFLYNQVKLK